MKFGENLKKVRNEKGFTLKQLSFRTGIDASQLSRYESGGALPSIETAAKIAIGLETTLDAMTKK